MKADGGLVNGKIAIDYIMAKVPEIDPGQLFACGHSSAAVVALNFAAGDTRANLVTVRLGTDGKVCFYSYGRTSVIADITGYLS